MNSILKHARTFVSNRLGNVIVNANEPTRERIFEMITEYQKQIEKTLNDKESAFDIMTELYNVMDKLDETKIPPPDEYRIQCKKGCAFCCHVEVMITETEAKALWEYCRINNIEIDVAHLNNQKELNEQTHAIDKHSKCVFLNDKNECGIYEFRPMGCRKHYVVSKPKHCDSKKYPKHGVMWYTNIDQEILTAALLNADVKHDSIARMLLKTK